MTHAQFEFAGTLAVIGGGRMGEAIVSGLLASGALSPDAVLVAEPVSDRRKVLEVEYGVTCFADAAEAAGRADLVLLAVKPQVIDDVVPTLADSVGGTLVVSIAAGITTARLEAMLPPDTPVVRVMPNTPAMVGEGMSLVSGGAAATQEQVDLVRELFDLLGKAVIVDEALQNAGTAISGSGPAYFAMFVDSLARAGAEQGLPYEVALELAIQTMRGTADLLEERGMTPEELVTAVSSPGGTTVAALGVFREADFDETVRSAVEAAVRRAKELGA